MRAAAAWGGGHIATCRHACSSHLSAASACPFRALLIIARDMCACNAVCHFQDNDISMRPGNLNAGSQHGGGAYGSVHGGSVKGGSVKGGTAAFESTHGGSQFGGSVHGSSGGSKHGGSAHGSNNGGQRRLVPSKSGRHTTQTAAAAVAGVSVENVTTVRRAVPVRMWACRSLLCVHDVLSADWRPARPCHRMQDALGGTGFPPKGRCQGPLLWVYGHLPLTRCTRVACSSNFKATYAVHMSAAAPLHAVRRYARIDRRMCNSRRHSGVHARTHAHACTHACAHTLSLMRRAAPPPWGTAREAP